MDLVDKKDCFTPRCGEPVLAGGNDPAQVIDVGGNRVDPFDLGIRFPADAMGQRRLAGAGRAIKNKRAEPVGFNGARQKLTCADNVFLSDILLQGARTHPHAQRRLFQQNFFVSDFVGDKVRGE